MATYTWTVKNTFLKVKKPNEPSTTMGRNQPDGRTDSCPPLGKDMTKDKGTAIAVQGPRAKIRAVKEASLESDIDILGFDYWVSLANYRDPNAWSRGARSCKSRF